METPGTSMTMNVGAMPRRIAQGALRQLPDAFSETWLRETWSGGHGRLRLRAELGEPIGELSLTSRNLSASASIGGSIVRRSGGNVGALSRRLDLHPNGRLGVYHAYLKIEPEVQRSGFASRFNDAAYARYAHAGVDDVTVTAALSAGGYVWARTGFELAVPAGVVGEQAEAIFRADKLRSLVLVAKHEGRISAADMRSLAPRLLPEDGQMRPDTLSSIRELAAMDGIGERVLKGQAWMGIRATGSPAPWWSGRPGLGGATDAAAGPAHLRPTDLEPAAMLQARRAVAALLPEQFEPSVFSHRLEHASQRGSLHVVRTGDEKTRIGLYQPSIHTSGTFTVVDDAGARVGSATLSIQPADDGTLVATRRLEYVPPGPGHSALRGALNDALRGMGVSRLQVETPHPTRRWTSTTRTYDLAVPHVRG
jgi:hypothetical protein